MDPEVSLLNTQELTTCPCPERLGRTGSKVFPNGS